MLLYTDILTNRIDSPNSLKKCTGTLKKHEYKEGEYKQLHFLLIPVQFRQKEREMKDIKNIYYFPTFIKKMSN